MEQAHPANQEEVGEMVAVEVGSEQVKVQDLKLGAKKVAASRGTNGC